MKVLQGGGARVRAKIKKVVNPHRLSARGLAFIAREEGLRLAPYNDAKGYATIGVGHLLHYSNVTAADVAKWRGFTQTQAYNLLRVDAKRFEDAVNKAVKVPINQAQFDALVSFAFNVGEGGMATSAAVAALNAGHPGQVPDLLHHWDDGGLLRGRRAREGALFAHSNYLA